MSPRHRTGGSDEALDDATVEALLSGGYGGDAPDLVAVGEVLGQMRSLAEGPPPPPSASLGGMLGSSAGAGGEAGRFGGNGNAPPLPHAPRRAAPLRSRVGSRPVVAAAAAAVAVAVVLVAGAARLLPGPTQDIVARIVRAMTPFHLPEEPEGANEDVSSGAAGSETAPPVPGPAAPAPGRPSPLPALEPPAHGGGDVEHDGDGVRPRPGGRTAAPAPAPPADGTPGGLREGGGGSLPSPPPESAELGAELTGATVGRAGDPDGRGTAAFVSGPGSDELCLTLVVSGVAPVTAVHVHGETPGIGGPIVTAWRNPVLGGPPVCTRVPGSLIDEMRREPERYYVDVHTTEFPRGALRGPLTAPYP